MKGRFTKEHIQKTHKPVKRCAISSVLREIDMKMTMKYHYTPIRMATSKIVTIPNAHGNADQLERSHVVSGDTRWYSHSREEFCSSTTKYATTP